MNGNIQAFSSHGRHSLRDECQLGGLREPDSARLGEADPLLVPLLAKQNLPVPSYNVLDLEIAI